MRPKISINFIIILLIFLSQLIPSPISTYAQNPAPQKVVATYSGPVADDASGYFLPCVGTTEYTLSFRLEVWNIGSAGGDEYSGASLLFGSHDLVMYGDEDFNICHNGDYHETTLYGTFTGGPNGTTSFEGEGYSANIQFVDGKKAIINIDVAGTYELTVENPEAFGTPITSEYIYNKYGIKVEDSFGDDMWEPASWTDQELVLLDEVLRELPPALIKKMAVKRIVRNKNNFDENGFPKTSTYGFYDPCNGKPWKDCDGSETTLRIFDNAWTPFDFSNDADGAIQFKGTILHELIHAVQFRSEQDSGLIDPYTNTLVQNYNDATREITNINDPGFTGWNGWKWGTKAGDAPPPTWHYDNAGDQPPTNYGFTNPMEDMSESVMMYVYEPQKLQASSMQRYNFIRDFIFEGVEYDNGTQK